MINSCVTEIPVGKKRNGIEAIFRERMAEKSITDKGIESQLQEIYRPQPVQVDSNKISLKHKIVFKTKENKTILKVAREKLCITFKRSVRLTGNFSVEVVEVKKL